MGSTERCPSADMNDAVPVFFVVDVDVVILTVNLCFWLFLWFREDSRRF